MSKNLKQKDLEFQKDWILFILQYLNEIYSSLGPPYFKEMEKATIEAYKSQDLRGLKLAAKDIVKWSRLMDEKLVSQLNDKLIEKFGVDLNSFNNMMSQIKSIIKRGVINSLDEYKLIFDYFEEIYTDEDKDEETDKISRLLEDYQRKTGKV